MPESLWQALVLFLARWESANWVIHAQHFVGGLAGAATYIAYRYGVLQLPYINRKSGTIKLYFLRELIIGGVLALMIDIAFPVSLFVGATGPPIMSVLIDTVIPSVGVTIGAIIDAVARQRINRTDDNDDGND